MGTHPIFESDFDCLTENLIKMLSRVARIPLRAITRKLSTTSPRKGSDLGLYNKAYRWHPYGNPMFTAMCQTLGVAFWVYMFWSWFSEGDHVLGHAGLPIETVVKPQFQSQVNKLYLNSELGLPSIQPGGGEVVEEGLSVKKRTFHAE